MANQTIRFRCPCCAKMLRLDPATGVATEVNAAEEAKTRAESEIDDLVTQQQREQERLGDAFSRAAQDTAKQSGKLDDLFDQALRDAKDEDDDVRPPNPFDLD